MKVVIPLANPAHNQIHHFYVHLVHLFLLRPYTYSQILQISKLANANLVAILVMQQSKWKIIGFASCALKNASNVMNQEIISNAIVVSLGISLQLWTKYLH